MACGEKNLGDTGSEIWDTDIPAACPPGGTLSIVPLDIWGRDLKNATLQLNYTPQFTADAHLGPSGQSFPMPQGGTDFELVVQAQDHVDFGLSFTVHPKFAMPLSISSLTEGGRVAWSAQMRDLEGLKCPNITVFTGLDTPFFSAAAPAPSLNRLTFMLNGQSFWLNVAEDLENTQDRVTWSTWLWESDFELLRPENHMELSTKTRRKNTLMSLLEAQPGVETRVLSNLFLDIDGVDPLYLDSELVDRAEHTHDDFEVIFEHNETNVNYYAPYTQKAPRWSYSDRVLANARYADWGVTEQVATDLDGLEIQAGSYHQKAMVFDGNVAYVGGFNSKGTDWDTSVHAVFDERRMEFDASSSEREDVYYGESQPDYLPRKDYGIRIEGPAVKDVEQVLWDRWEEARDNRDLYSENTTPFALDPRPKEKKQGSLTQIVSTLPAPYQRQEILESHRKAFSQAEEYIYIEDQYFRSPILLETIFQRMQEVPDLHLFVVTNAVAEEDPGLKWTALGDALMRTHFPGRYIALQVRSFDVTVDEGVIYDDVYPFDVGIELHSKMRIVDDKWLSVGSCNFNNRGLLYEGEMNVEVLDPNLAKPVREAIFSHLVGDYWSDYLSDDPGNNLAVFQSAAEYNFDVVDWWLTYAHQFDADEAREYAQDTWPIGFVHPVYFSSQYWWDVGPDIF
jgi:phosphatidylserine/phosphatidylglycerophosphate/cardiolipin synthase-like enzyme